jgi:hypothetical protein
MYGKKMARTGRTKVIYKGTFISKQSLIGKKWLEMVVKQTLRQVANFGHQTLGLIWLNLLHQMESLLETTNKIM